MLEKLLWKCVEAFREPKNSALISPKLVFDLKQFLQSHYLDSTVEYTTHKENALVNAAIKAILPDDIQTHNKKIIAASLDTRILSSHIRQFSIYHACTVLYLQGYTAEQIDDHLASTS